MLRIHCLQQWYSLSDPGAEEALYDIQSMRAFACLELGRDAISDETTILNFRHLLEHHDLTKAIFATALYGIETEIRGRSANERREARQARSKPIDAMKTWLAEQLAKLPRGSETTRAIGYELNRWEGLSRFLDDGRIEIDTNTVERSIRPIALNRKNALFAGSDEGGANWAIVASLIETCKLNGVNPHAWLADTLTNSSAAGPHPASMS